MKSNTRYNVFESNSSSVHTLTISRQWRELSKFIPDENDYIHIDYGYFGKNNRIYDTQYDKLSYLVTLCAYCANLYGQTKDTYQFKCIEEAVKKYTGCNGIIIDEEVEPEIDHQSCPWDGDITFINIYDEDSVIDFVFNRYAALKTTCD